MTPFLVYPKKGKAFEIEMYRFEFSKTEFVLYNELDHPSKDGFLAFDQVSAIVRKDLLERKEPPNAAYRARIYFEVHLKDREDTISISAEKVDLSDPPSLTFYVRNWAGNDPFPLTGIYIALEDVIAVLPSDGLRAPSSR